MASLGKKDGIYNVRFRYGDRAFKRSLGTADYKEADYASCGVKQRLHELGDGKVVLPPGSDLCDFVMGTGLAGGTAAALATVPSAPRDPDLQPAVNASLVGTSSFSTLRVLYLASQKNWLSDAYIYSQRTHLGQSIGRDAR